MIQRLLVLVSALAMLTSCAEQENSRTHGKQATGANGAIVFRAPGEPAEQSGSLKLAGDELVLSVKVSQVGVAGSEREVGTFSPGQAVQILNLAPGLWQLDLSQWQGRVPVREGSGQVNIIAGQISQLRVTLRPIVPGNTGPAPVIIEPIGTIPLPPTGVNVEIAIDDSNNPIGMPTTGPVGMPTGPVQTTPQQTKYLCTRVSFYNTGKVGSGSDFQYRHMATLADSEQQAKANMIARGCIGRPALPGLGTNPLQDVITCAVYTGPRQYTPEQCLQGQPPQDPVGSSGKRYICLIDQAPDKPYRATNPDHHRKWFGTVMATGPADAESRLLHSICTRSQGTRAGSLGEGCTTLPGDLDSDPARYNRIINFGRYLEGTQDGRPFADDRCFETYDSFLYSDTYAPQN